ncbi:MAG: hypothetical protein LBC64_04995 [Fibromonadaceae bacterium]|jgi:hypothetical protein|nr:hypothetical protein [Fibromonadaceae bacterium]
MEKKELTAADVWAMFAETDRQMKETDRKMAESYSRLDKKFEELGLKVKDLKSNVVGIGDSNGEFAEEYFYSSLKRKMEFAGVHFDDVYKDIKQLRKMPNGERLQDQFDIIMINDDAVALVEIKYTARKGYPATMVNQKVPNFRTLFPDYANYKIYLGIGAFSFEESVEQEAQKLGIGLLRQVGETIEYETKWVKAY